MKILVVDDDDISRLLATNILAKAGYDVLDAASAKKAIEYLETGEAIRLLVSDIMMPEMDGLELLAYIRKNLGFMELPVIMYTAKRDRATVVQAIKMGIKDYMAKPIDAGKLLKKIKKVIDSDTQPLADQKQMLNKLQIDNKTYTELLDNLTSTITSKVEEIKTTIEQNDFETIIFTIDTIMTASINLGAERILPLSKKLGSMAKKQDADSCQKILLALIREVNILEDEIVENKKAAEKSKQKSGRFTSKI